MALLAHTKGTQIATLEQVLAVETPPKTKTFNPIPHGQLIETIKQACTNIGIEIKREEYCLAHNGARLFANYELEPFMRGNGRAFQLGFRQGINKTMAIGVCAGLRVFVCDNMMFDGEFLEFRKHTSGLDLDELLELSVRAVGSSMKKMENLKGWHDSLRTFALPEPDMKALTYDAMTQGVFPPAHLGRFLTCYQNEREDQVDMGKDPDSLYSWHGGVTRLLRGKSLFQVAESNRLLMGLCDNYTMSLAA